VLAKNVVLVFDGDSAGISAARRSLAILCENDFTAKVLLLPEGEDPDSFLNKNGTQPFQKLIVDAMSMIEFFLAVSKGEKIDHVRDALGMIAGVKDMLRAEEMLRELADRSRMNESVLRTELEKIRKKAGSQSLQTPKSAPSRPRREEYLLLSAIVSFPEKADSVLSRLNIEDIRDKTIGSLFQKLGMLAADKGITSLLDDADEAERRWFELSLPDSNVS
jgi:DNA primase